MGNRQQAWIVVADREHGRFFSHAGPGAVLEVAAEEILAKSEGDPSADRPGRAFDSQGAGRHAMEPPTDYKQQQLHTMAGRVSEVVSEAFNRHDFARLVLVAPPKTLGELRESLPAAIHKTIVAELPSHLTQVDRAELAERLSEQGALGLVRAQPPT